jgi:hypothetical protein
MRSRAASALGVSAGTRSSTSMTSSGRGADTPPTWEERMVTAYRVYTVDVESAGRSMFAIC